MATANLPEQPLGRRVDPADDSRSVEDVTRDTDAGQSLLDVAADSQAGGHPEVCPIRTAVGSRQGRVSGGGGI